MPRPWNEAAGVYLEIREKFQGLRKDLAIRDKQFSPFVLELFSPHFRARCEHCTSSEDKGAKCGGKKSGIKKKKNKDAFSREFVQQSRAVLGMDLGIAGIPRNSRLVCRESQIVLTAGINSLWECSGSQGSSGSGDSWLHGHGGAHESGMVSGMFPWIRDGVWEEPTDQGNILLPRA